MSERVYKLPTEQTSWVIPTGADVVFDWGYDDGRDKLLSLYEKGKNLQRNSNARLDWAHEVPFENPFEVPDEVGLLWGSDLWERLPEKQRIDVRRHVAAWQISQFLHGEQGALVCSARIVETVPGLDAKFYAATQVMDEARHVEAFSKLLRDKLDVAYPINPNLKSLLDQVLRDRRWDMTYLGMQVLIEGLALAAFNVMRDLAGNALVRALTAYVIQDEARHVAFGRMALREYYPQLTESERAEREEFVIEASHLMRDRFLGEEVWARLELDQAACVAHVNASFTMNEYRKLLFSRIVPIIRDIGLWGPRVREAYEKMGVLVFADADTDAIAARDEQIAQSFDEQRKAEIEQAIARAPGG